MSSYRELTPEQISHFIQHGWIKLSNCFTPEEASLFTADVWTRLGYSPTDRSTWTAERINMPHHRDFDIETFSPKAWDGICDLLGSPDLVPTENRIWRDSLIVNLGTDENEGKDVHPHKLFGWHVDGDFFVHYLDSPEQGLLVIPLFSDIAPGGGGTMICPEAIPKMAAHLYAHPEGVSPRMTPRGDNPNFEEEKGLNWFNKVAQSCEHFVEATGSIGDVYLLHPLMLHSASSNKLRTPRIITNPPISLRQPFNFDRPQGEEFSIVEQTTLRALGKERLKGWKITGGRQNLVPERLRIQQKMKEEELERLKAKKVNVTSTEVTSTA